MAEDIEDDREENQLPPLDDFGGERATLLLFSGRSAAAVSLLFELQ